MSGNAAIRMFPKAAEAVAPPAAVLLIDSTEAARRLSIGTRTLWSLTAAGEIPVVKIGRLVRYRAVDLENFAAAKAARTNGRGEGRPGA